MTGKPSAAPPGSIIELDRTIGAARADPRRLITTRRVVHTASRVPHGKTGPMETMLDAIQRLRTNGYHLDLIAAPGGQLRCGECGDLADAADVTVEETVRFEGDSNPDDEEILIAMSTPCGHRGLYSAAYGPDTPVHDVQVLGALATR